MVVVTRRLRSVVAPTSKTEDLDFQKDAILPTSYGVTGRPLEDEPQVFQESHPDPTITVFKPFTAPVSIVNVPSHIRSETTIDLLSWIFALAAGIFLGVIIYLLSQKFPYYPSTVIPIPTSGLFNQTSYHLPASFSNLPTLPSISANNLNLNPMLPFPIR